MAANPLPPVVDVIFDFLSQEELDQKKAFLEAHRELRTPHADVIFGWLIDQLRAPKDQPVVQRLVDARTLIRIVRDAGLERTFADMARNQALLSGACEFAGDVRQASRLWLRYENTDDPDALTEGLSIWEHMVIRPDFALASSDVRAYALDSIALGLMARYKTAGRADDLDRALTFSEQALALTPADTPVHARRLSYRGILLRQRFEATGSLADLHDAIGTFQEASLHAGADPVATAEPLNNLGNSLSRLFVLSENRDDLDAAIQAHEKAVEATLPNSPARAIALGGVGQSLLARYHLSGDPDDLATALRDTQLALDLTPPDSHGRSSSLLNLGVILKARFDQRHEPADLDAAIQYYEQALDAASAHDSGRALVLGNLGDSLRDRYNLSGHPEDLRRTTETWRQACEAGLTASVGQTFRAGRSWGQFAVKRADWPAAVEALSYAAQAVERLFKTQLVRNEKETWLRLAQEIPSLTAYALARCGRVRDAVVALEAGRARLLAEAQERERRDLQHLAEIGYEDLYTRYSAAAAHLSLSGENATRDLPLPSGTSAPANLRAAYAELESAIQDIRQVAGYQDFLAAPTFEQIQEALTTPFSIGSGPAVGILVLATSAGGLAFIVHPRSVEPVWLALDEQELNQVLVDRRDGKVVGGYLTGRSRAEGMKQTLEQLPPWLGQKLMGPIARALMDILPVNEGGAPPSVYLIPSGRLALLPLHAATYEIDGGTRAFLDDYAVAYAPSAKTLRFSRQALDLLPQRPSDLLAVGNPLPLPDGLPPLTFARLEVEEIKPFFGERTRLLCEADAMRTEVERNIGTARYLHLACHGLFDAFDPLGSGLVLSQGEILTLGELLAGPRLSAVRLAVLSACQTAITDFADLPEEAIGLPAGFLQVGVPGVVGSLWSVDDVSTMLLIVKMYEYHLHGDPESGHGPLCPAHALRRAQLWLRDATNEQLSRLFQHYRLTALDRPGRLRTAYARAASHFWMYTLAPRRQQPFASALYWAAFTFHGL